MDANQIQHGDNGNQIAPSFDSLQVELLYVYYVGQCLLPETYKYLIYTVAWKFPFLSSLLMMTEMVPVCKLLCISNILGLTIVNATWWLSLQVFHSFLKPSRQACLVLSTNYVTSSHSPKFIILTKPFHIQLSVSLS